MTKLSQRRVPAEWEPQSAVQLTWPHPGTDWADDLLAVERVFIQIAVEISQRQDLIIACTSKAHANSITNNVIANNGDPAKINCAVAASNDTWARDHGPITVIEKTHPRLLDFKFDGWGRKYPANLDNMITRELAEAGTYGDTPVESIELEIEGGALEFDGHGSLLTTTSCLVENRNTKLSTLEEYENLFMNLFGVVETHWLLNGKLEGDDTDGHIDTLARFADANTIVYQGCNKPDDSHFESLKDMAEELHAFRNYDCKPYKLIELPFPNPVLDASGKRLPANYANFLIINDAVLFPTYNDPADNEAHECLQTCFPDRAIIGINCLALLKQRGSLHCVTMQYPAGVVPVSMTA